MVIAFRSFLQAAEHLQQDDITATEYATKNYERCIRQEYVLCNARSGCGG